METKNNFINTLLITWPHVLGIKLLKSPQQQEKECQRVEGKSRERKPVIKI